LAAGVAGAIEKLFHLDTALVFDGYLQDTVSELKATTKKAVAYAARLEEKVAEVEVLSRIDSLTGLLNRRAFHEELRKELNRAMRNGLPLSLLYLDVDEFKSINDNYGHAKGDEILITIAQALKEDLRETDFAGRLGGDEFCVLFSAADHEQAHAATERFAERLRKVTSQTVSIGIATTGPEEFSLPEVLIAERQVHV
jgi:diguanylate cyclase (GGDEF)-like protein